MFKDTIQYKATKYVHLTTNYKEVKKKAVLNIVTLFRAKFHVGVCLCFSTVSSALLIMYVYGILYVGRSKGLLWFELDVAKPYMYLSLVIVFMAAPLFSQNLSRHINKKPEHSVVI